MFSNRRPCWRDALLAVLASALPVAAQEPRPEVHVVEGACPFECCQYGVWTVERTVRLRTVPRPTAGVVATLEPGDTVQAETGEVRIRPAPFVFRIDFGDFVAGDTAWVLDYQGEGRFAVLKDGARVVADLGFSPYGGPSAGRCENCAHGRLYGEYTSEWWVRVRAGSGVVGWTSSTDAFGGTDACAR